MLDGWPGSMVVVSHDRYFLERACDHVVALLDEKLAYLPGGVAEYLDRRGDTPRQPPEVKTMRTSAQNPTARPADGQDRAVGRAARQRTAQKELARLERQLSKLSSQETELTETLAEHASDYAKLIELGAQLREIQDEKAGLEDRWLTLAEELSG
jgi:ATP-binding cassette subfamily F protein uup